ncbi:hypothetical protein PROFUN_07911 [Planoprotostelium fungivorum]|uniref:Uncharacterized protein n=1 Tax=Planoprotostelium fungivorum TaxID=1890364 RepID=A0A2P6NL16_9EUKA|nr:hypothetical protein PROFUN_07911 [Planoprotostelium fungivorum]
MTASLRPFRMKAKKIDEEASIIATKVLDFDSNDTRRYSSLTPITETIIKSPPSKPKVTIPKTLPSFEAFFPKDEREPETRVLMNERYDEPPGEERMPHRRETLDTLYPHMRRTE